MKNIIGLFIFSLFFPSGLSAQINLKINVQDYGAKGDGISNNYYSLKKVYDAINRNGGGEIFFPKGVYYINEYHSPENNLPDLILENCNYLKISGDEASISVKGDFKRTITRVGKKHVFSDIYAITPFNIVNCDNVVVQDLEIRGNVQQTTRDENVVEAGGRLIYILGSRNVTLKNITNTCMVLG